MKNDLGPLKRKMFFQVLAYGLLAFVLVWLAKIILIDGLLEAPFAEGFIRFCMDIWGFDSTTALRIYNEIFRQNKQVYLNLGLILTLILLFYWSFAQITKYFTEINESLDQLLAESGEEITLRSEMHFMEIKLSKIKSTLVNRERAAKEAEQRKNDLVVYLAHDIKTPLTSVIGYLNLLDEAPDMPLAQRAKYIGLTLEKAYRLEDLINEFFEITRFNLQSIVLYKEKINLALMLQQLADEFYPLLSPQGKTAQIQVSEQLFLFADADKLARVFNNILKNALAYSYENSEIIVAAQEHAGRVRLTFTNQGDPIPPEKLETIFEKFYRLDTSRSTKTGGSGLGLAIAKEIVTAHEGEISVQSEQGLTTFCVEIPNLTEPNKGTARLKITEDRQ